MKNSAYEFGRNAWQNLKGTGFDSILKEELDMCTFFNKIAKKMKCIAEIELDFRFFL